MLKASWQKYTLEFKRAAGTSRGVLKTKDSYFIKLIDTKHPNKIAWGECGILKRLSFDDREGYEDKLDEICKNSAHLEDYLFSGLEQWPSLYFGVEMALRDLESGSTRHLFQNKFSSGLEPITINGLIWMGDYDFMRSQIIEKLENGFDCVKLKIGAIDFNSELELLKLIRKDFSSDTLELRVDANGAFTSENAEQRLSQLAKYQLHSIEQPIKAGNWESMRQLCSKNILPIALDEELIGITDIPRKRRLLDSISPQYIILKPSLIGGFKGSLEWINLAERAKIEWWVTSALESNIGLNAIAQWTASLNNKMPQGLGTGGLYTNNFDSPLVADKGQLSYKLDLNWDLSKLE